MVRFIIECKFKNVSGCEGRELYTIDGDLLELEKRLKSGGCSENAYEYHALIGVEIIPDKG